MNSATSYRKMLQLNTFDLCIHLLGIKFVCLFVCLFVVYLLKMQLHCTTLIYSYNDNVSQSIYMQKLAVLPFFKCKVTSLCFVVGAMD